MTAQSFRAQQSSTIKLNDCDSDMCILNFMAISSSLCTGFPAHAACLTVMAWKNLVGTWLKPVVLSCLSSGEASGVRQQAFQWWHTSTGPQPWFKEKKAVVKAGRFKKVASTSASCHVIFSFFILHSFVSRLLFVWNISGSSFPFSDSWRELVAAWRSGQREDADGSILMSPRLLGRDMSEQVETDLLTYRTYIHTHTDAHIYRNQCIQSHASTVCVEGTYTHLFHLHFRLLLDTLIQGTSNRVKQQGNFQKEWMNRQITTTRQSVQ